MKRKCSRVLFTLLLLVPASVLAQLPPLPWDQGAAGLALALRRLPRTARVMLTTAHPDDEDNPLLVLLARGRGLETALLTLTRGDGGQNEIGPELFDALGILRTGELMSMHRYDGARQFFSRASDFGYSFSVEETLRKWGRQEILSDVVRVIRTFRPDVILTLPLESRGGGQHHQAAARLTAEAFRAAADAARFPEQLRQGLFPWQAKKLYQRHRFEGGGAGEKKPADLTIQTGGFDPLLGRTFFEVGMEARSLHRCQGMAQLQPPPRPGLSQWDLIDSVLPAGTGRGLLDGIDSSLFAIEGYAPAGSAFLHAGLERLSRAVEAARSAFDFAHPERATVPLAQGLREVRRLRERVASSDFPADARYQVGFLLEAKQRQFEDALRRSLELRLFALADDGEVVPGQRFQVRAILSLGSPSTVRIRRWEVAVPQGWRVEAGPVPETIPSSGTIERVFRVHVGEKARWSRPYWTRGTSGAARYTVRRPADLGLPWSPARVVVRADLVAGDTPLRLAEPARFRYLGRWVGGQQRHRVLVVPAVSLEVSPRIAVLPLEQAAAGRDIHVRILYSGRDPTEGTVGLDLPPGWRARPASALVRFSREGESATRVFHLSPPAGVAAGRRQVRVWGRFGGQIYREGFQTIDYHHIERRLLDRPASSQLEIVDVRVRPGIKMGYIMGVGDRVPEALEQMGIELHLLTPEELASGDLDRFQVIMTGVRAYLARPDLRENNRRLLEWVRRGGTLLVQYNKFEMNRVRRLKGKIEMEDSPYTPYPAQVGRGRVTDETAPVEMLAPQDPLFQRPNRIGESDWTGWVQERGLYFLGRKDSRYRDLIRMEDPFPNNAGKKLGALVVARYGHGKWVYIGLGLWRQLPAGVPGAYRLLANLVSY